jgi:hypothetical protein
LLFSYFTSSSGGIIFIAVRTFSVFMECWSFVNKTGVVTIFIVALPVSIPAPFVPSADRPEDHVLRHHRRAPCVFYHTWLLLGGLNKTDQVNERVTFWIFIHSLTALNLERVSVTLAEIVRTTPIHICLLIRKMYIILRNSPQWAGASSFTRFLDYTQRHNTVSRIPLDE